MAYFTHRITNSASETLNSTIQMIKKRAFGFPQLRQLPCRHPVPLRRPSATSLIRATRNPEESPF
jgi:hypothetical protein